MDSTTIQSWFLHHNDHPRWWRPRRLELNGHWRFWLRDVLDGWRDVYQPDQEVDFAICFPDPPRPHQVQNEIILDLIVIQGLHMPRTAGLISVLQSDRSSQIDFTLAVSLPEYVSGLHLATCAEVTHACTGSGCEIKHADVIIPCTFDYVHEMQDGDSFTIRLQHELSSASSTDRMRQADGQAEVRLSDPITFGSPTSMTTTAMVHHVDSCQEGCNSHKVCEEGNLANDEPMMLPAGTPVHPPSPVYVGNFRWIDDLHQIYLAQAEIEVLEQAPLLYIQTWYVDHERHRTCRNPRTIRIDNHVITWMNLIRETWLDQLDRSRPFEISVVHPPPPQPRWQNYGCHLIIEQGHSLREVAGLITVLFEGRNNDGILIAATSLPRIVRITDLVEALDLQPQAERSRCSAWFGQTRLHLVAAEEIVSGAGICLHLLSHFGTLGRDVTQQPFADIVFPEGTWDGDDLPDIEALTLLQLPVSFENPRAGDALDVPPESPECHAYLPRRGGPSAAIADLAISQSFMHFVQDLFPLWAQFAVSDWQEEPASMTIATWFLDHSLRYPICREPRVVTLYSDARAWESRITQAWTDQIAPGEPLGFFLVSPQPPNLEHRIAGHVLVIQRPNEEWASSLVTLQDSTIGNGMRRLAVTTDVDIRLESLFLLTGSYGQCVMQPDRFRCSAWYHDLQLSFERPLRGANGCGIELRIQSIRQGAAQAQADENTPSQGGLFEPDCSFASQVHAFIELSNHFLRQVTHVDPQVLSMQESAADEVVTAPKHVKTWFLHHCQHRTCYHFRWVETLFESDFEANFRITWNDKCASCDCLSFFRLDDGCVIGAFLDPLSSDRAVLAESRQYGESKDLTILRATFAPEWVTPAALRSIFGLHSDVDAAPQLQSSRCLVEGCVLPEGQSQRLHHGFRLLLTWHQKDIAQANIHVDFEAVLRVHEFLDNHFFMPIYDLPHDFPWHPASLDWLECEWWQPGVFCSAVRIYYDGSSIPQGHHRAAGCAVAAFVCTLTGWQFAGAISAALGSGTGSYVAELHAAIVAHKFLHDLLKLIAVSQTEQPHIELCYDSETVGHQASGEWQVLSHPAMGSFLRSLHRCVESKLQCSINHRHVRAHVGEPGNELVDVLAFQAASGRPLHDLQAWFEHVLQKQFVQAAEWMWFIFRPDIHWDSTSIVFPAGPSTLPTSQVFPSQFDQLCTPSDDVSGELEMTVATCNVLSLLPPPDQRRGIESALSSVGPARQESLLQQFHEAGVHIFAWQETRLRKFSARHDDRYWLYRSPANDHGHYGIIVGLQRRLPIGHLHKPGSSPEEIFISDQDVAIVDAQPRSLILRIHNALLRCILVAGHAPHTGAGEANIRHWWDNLASLLPKQYHNWDIVLLVDANARVGAEPCSSIGEHQAEAHDPKAEGFANFLRQHGIWLPATFAACQDGPGGTWRHNNGSWHRNDYVGLPGAWSLSACKAWVSFDIDTSLTKEDHRTALVSLKRSLTPYSQRHHRKSLKLHFQVLDPTVLQQVARPAWTCDVHSHCHLLQDEIVQALWDQRRIRKATPQKQTMTPDTWQLVQDKRSSRNLLASRHQVQRQTLLEAWFACWRHAVHDCPFQPLSAGFDSLLREQDQLVALAYHDFRRLGRQVLKALKHDDVLFYSGLLADCTEFLQPSQAKDLWRIVRRSLPRFQQRRMSMKPFQLEPLEDQWLPHYCELEAGVQISPDQLLDDCLATQACHRLDAPSRLCLEDLPSLMQLEHTFRATSAGKATGHDTLPSDLYHVAAKELALLYHDLVLKTYLWQNEPIQAKGGPVALIPKVLSPSFAKQFRGILLLPSAGKRAHAILRKQVMTTLWPARAQGQMGGFPAQQVLFGSHALRTFGVLCDRQGLRHGSHLADCSAPPRHSSTHVVHFAQSLAHRVAQALDGWLRDQVEYQQLLTDLDVEAPSVIWADDIAIPLAAARADQILPLLQAALQQARDALRGYGFSLNLAKGKTSAVLTFRGPQASEYRKKYQLHDNAGIMCSFPDGQEAWLHLVPAYRHLGALFTSSHDIACELRARVGIAKTAFAQLSRPVLTNRRLPVKIRLQMFHALVSSKLFFGLGAWVTPPPKQLQYLQHAFVTMLKRVMRLGSDHYPDDQVLSMAGTADLRSRLAAERLLYAHRLFRSGPVFVQMLIQKEFDKSEGSWLHGLRADLCWLDSISPGCLPIDWQADMTSLFEHWQDPANNWDTLVKRTWKKHVLQSHIMSDARRLHSAVFRNLREAGATFAPSATAWEDLEAEFVCFCERRFASRRGLLAHQRRSHALFSIEHQFLQGCTCLHCGKYMWTTQRLQQHLAYIPKTLGYNPCFQALMEQARQVPYQKEGNDTIRPFAGLARREALATAGPRCDPTPAAERKRIKIQAELEACRTSLQFPYQPADPLGFGAKIGELLSHVTVKWFQRHFPHGTAAHDRAQLVDDWIEVLYAAGQESDDDLDPWLEFAFLTWGEHWLPDVLAQFDDGVAEREVDEIFADFACQLDRYQTLARIAHLEHVLRLCSQPEPTPHRTPYVPGVLRHPKVSSKAHQEVIRAFAEQTKWQADVRSMCFLDLPPDRSVPKVCLPEGREVFLIVHLFSGRRRTQDIHQYVCDLAGPRQLPVLVLSLDTAVSLEYGNLALDSPSWRLLYQIYQAGVVAATIIGSPCETFSEARFMAPPEGTEVRSWPRPLRSADAIFGLEGLTMRELRQAHMGGNFYQQGALALSCHMQKGGMFISEHPAKPSDPTRPSVWSSALLEVLMRHPEVKLSTVPQYLWGATAVKPTGLLQFRLPRFGRDLFSCADPHAVKPSEAAIGCDAAGRFRTSQHKEYPPQFCCGIATALVNALSHSTRCGAYHVAAPLPPHLARWIQEAAQACTAFSANSWLPDYQGV
eukprot:s3397_g3.t1